MASRAGGPEDTRPGTERLAPHRSDRSPWNWLLVLPIVVPLLVPLYNRQDPTLFGWPFFYWFQLSLVALGVVVTTLVFRFGARSTARGGAAPVNSAAEGRPSNAGRPTDETDGGR